MMPARICIVAPEFPGPFHNGGVGTACYWQAVTLSRAGHEVTVLYTGPTEHHTPSHWAAHYASTIGIGYCDLSDLVTRRQTRVDLPAHTCSEERTALLVLAYLRKHSFDIVHFQEFLGHGARALQAQRTGAALLNTRTTVTLHSCRQWIYEGMRRLPSTRDDAVVDFLERDSAALADRVIAPSRHIADWVRARWGFTRAIDVIPNCFDASGAGSAAVVNHAGPFTHLVFFGRLETRKGLHFFVRALEQSATARMYVERVTFLGRHSRVENRPSDEYLEEARRRLPSLQIDVRCNMDSQRALEWLADQTGMLVVAPSLGDNLPYTVVELHTRRIPFVSTDVGGIPDIVGRANTHQLATPTAEGLADTLERVLRDGALCVDYRDGYDVHAANAQHCRLVDDLATSAPPAIRRPSDRVAVVVTDAMTSSALDASRYRFQAAGADTNPIEHWHTLEEWRCRPAAHLTLFTTLAVTPRPALIARLARALRRSQRGLATSFYEVAQAGEADRATLVAPLGGSLEVGWQYNCFGGPVFIATPEAARTIAARSASRLAHWPLYAAAARQHGLAIIPEVLYAAAHVEPLAVDDVMRALDVYADAVHDQTLDLGWLLKMLRLAFHPATAGVSNAGRALYDRLVSTPDHELRAYAALDPTAALDPFATGLAAMRERLTPHVARWHAAGHRVAVCGAEEHTRLLLATCPALGPLVTTFIDRDRTREWLGKPCVPPERLTPELVDAIVYSSPEHDTDMFARLRVLDVEHVHLYSASHTH